MTIQLTPIEARVIGSLIEKEITTPEYYPLTLNSLTLACNQKSNREPVMDLTEKEVALTIESLKEKKLIFRVSVSGARVPKYRHDMLTYFKFSAHELGLICVLLLRGPQTPGELRSRTNRLCEFNDLDEVEQALERLINWQEGALVVRLPREAGRREQRYAHLLCGEVKIEESTANLPLEPAAIEAQSEMKRIELLEQKVESLQDELNQLKNEFFEFRKQFD
jgi:uncharacterized protein